MGKKANNKSKFLSLVLRHDPAAAGVSLDSQGWTEIEPLLRGTEDAGVNMTREELENIVRESDKARFSIRGDRIRANQGHSLSVDLGLESLEPPDTLFHGTVARFIDSIT